MQSGPSELPSYVGVLLILMSLIRQGAEDKWFTNQQDLVLKSQGRSKAPRGVLLQKNNRVVSYQPYHLDIDSFL